MTDDGLKVPAIAVTSALVIAGGIYTLFNTELSAVKADNDKDVARIDASIINLNATLATIRDLTAKVDALNGRADELDRRLVVAESSILKGARDPVEKATLDAIADATGKRIDLLQDQLTDINRQIAAVLLTAEGNRTKLPP
jgi:Mg2+ and Co2+ transporter CorA